MSIDFSGGGASTLSPCTDTRVLILRGFVSLCARVNACVRERLRVLVCAHMRACIHAGDHACVHVSINNLWITCIVRVRTP